MDKGIDVLVPKDRAELSGGKNSVHYLKIYPVPQLGNTCESPVELLNQYSSAHVPPASLEFSHGIFSLLHSVMTLGIPLESEDGWKGCGCNPAPTNVLRSTCPGTSCVLPLGL